MTTHQLATAAAKGIDTEDFLDNIAWKEAILPRLAQQRDALTRLLVDLTLRPAAPNIESREQVAGKIFGIDWIIKEIEKIVTEGRQAREALGSQNLSIQ